MSELKAWKKVSSANVDPPPDGAPEGMNRPEVNDTMREMMGALRRWYDYPEFIDINDGATVSRDSGTDIRITGADLTSYYVADRRIRLDGGGEVFGFVTSSSFPAGDTIVSVEVDAGGVVPVGTDVAEVSGAKLARSAYGASIDILEIMEFTR